MRLDNKTTEILKSFAVINPSLLVRKGNYLSTISSSKTIMAKAKLDQEFPIDFAVYELPRFLSVLSLSKEAPDLVFEANQVRISSGNQKIHYTYADPSTIISAPEKGIKLPTEDIKFTLTAGNLRTIRDAASALGLPEIGIVGDGEKIHLQAFDTKNSTSDFSSIEIGDTDKEFKVVFKAEYFKVLPQDYQVAISAKGISHLRGDFVEYWIAIESQGSDFSKL